jgi:hypothetical protein
MSEHSPRPVANPEVMTRFVFSPMFVDKKGGLKPNFWSHVFNKGLSVQRDSLATDNELREFVRYQLDRQARWAWRGVVAARCVDLRKIRVSYLRRSVCVYDTGEANNPAHAELFAAQNMPEADAVELRYELQNAFGDGRILDSTSYRGGVIWSALPAPLQARPR